MEPIYKEKEQISYNGRLIEWFNGFSGISLDTLSENFKFRKIKNTEGNFHPKCIIFDAKKAYIGSANLTYKAIKGKNIELGVLIHEDAIGSVKTLEKMFKELWGKAEELS